MSNRYIDREAQFCCDLLEYIYLFIMPCSHKKIATGYAQIMRDQEAVKINI